MLWRQERVAVASMRDIMPARREWKTPRRRVEKEEVWIRWLFFEVRPKVRREGMGR